MNGKRAKALRKLVEKACQEKRIINERDLTQVSNGSLELEPNTIRANYKKMKKLSHKA